MLYPSLAFLVVPEMTLNDRPHMEKVKYKLLLKRDVVWFSLVENVYEFRNTALHMYLK